MEYVPNAYINLCVDKNQQRANNQLIYDFKAGKTATTRFCAELLISYLRRQYGRLLEDFVVVFAPCSAQWKYNKRFGYLAAILNQAGIKTANEHVRIYGERKPTHNGGSHHVSEELYHVAIDGSYFAGKNVILFDDLLTSGQTINEFKEQLEAAGSIHRARDFRRAYNSSLPYQQQRNPAGDGRGLLRSSSSIKEMLSTRYL